MTDPVLLRGEIVRLGAIIKYLRGELKNVVRIAQDGQSVLIAGSIAGTALDRTKGEEGDHY